MVLIRAARPDEAAGLAAVAAVTFPLACPPHTTDAAKAHFIETHLSEERFVDYLADPARDLLVIDEDGLRGYAMLVAGEPGDADVRRSVARRPTVELSKCYVLPAAHGTGAAAALITAAVDRARARGAASLWLGVNQENARANAFYAKHGFALVGTKRFLVGDRYEDDFVRERTLD